MKTIVAMAIALALVAQNTTGPLKILVIEGEGAVNVVQQKTAVAPVVEVRDRNDQPVAGAVVTFAVRSGRAAFNGVRTLTVTTNAAGRAAAAGFAPTGTGAVQISATAAFQGQTAAVTIAQANVMTAAQAANASAAGAGGGGGGLGTGTIVGISAGAAGGVVGLKMLRDYRRGDPPTIDTFEAFPSPALANTRVIFAAGSSFHDENDEGVTLTIEFGDGGAETRHMSFGDPGAPIEHFYSNPGTYTARATLTDPVGRTATGEVQVPITSLSSQWTSSLSAGVYTLTQSGRNVTGSFSSGPLSGSVSGSITENGFVQITWPTIVGGVVVTPSFAGSLEGPPSGTGASNPNRLVGRLSGAGFNNTQITISR